MRIGISSSVLASKSIYRAANSGRSPVKDMGVDHRRLYIAVAQKFLYGSNVIAAFEQVSGEGMLERMASGPFGKASFPHTRGNRLLHDGFMDMMPPFLTGFRILPAVFLRKDPLTAPHLCYLQHR